MSDSTRITTWIAKEIDDILQPLRRMKNVKKMKNMFFMRWYSNE